MNGKFVHKVNSMGGYDVYYVDDAGHEKKVNSDKPDYLKWIAEGNTPELISYTVVIQSDTPTPEQLLEQFRLQAIAKSRLKMSKQLDAGFKFTIDNVEYEFDTTPLNRELIDKLAKIASVSGDDYTKEVILKNGLPLVINKVSIIALATAMLVDGQPRYDRWVTEHKKLLVATKEQLEFYMQNGALPITP